MQWINHYNVIVAFFENFINFLGKNAPWNDDDEKEVHEKRNNKTIMELWWIGTSITINRIEKLKEEV